MDASNSVLGRQPGTVCQRPIFSAARSLQGHTSFKIAGSLSWRKRVCIVQWHAELNVETTDIEGIASFRSVTSTFCFLITLILTSQSQCRTIPSIFAAKQDIREKNNMAPMDSKAMTQNV
jgi:hypothetical protein